MEQEEIREIWAEGEEWVIKRQNHEFFHRPHGKFGEWRPGLPSGIYTPDAEILFEEE